MVMKFKVKPKACTAMKLETTAMGKVKPVITVLRQDFKNNKTMATVKSAPSIKVRCTPTKESLTPSLDKLITRSSMSEGSCFFNSSKACLTPSPVLTMLASCCLNTSMLMALCVLMRAKLSNSLSRMYKWPKSPTATGKALRCCTTTAFKSR